MIHFGKLFYGFQKSHPSIAYINVSMLDNWIKILIKRTQLKSSFIFHFIKLLLFVEYHFQIHSASLWNFAKYSETIVKFNHLMPSCRQCNQRDNINLFVKHFYDIKILKSTMAGKTNCNILMRIFRLYYKLLSI